MRHARDSDLDHIESLLMALRERKALTERKRGIFYRGAKAFLHFHEHEGDLFADVKVGEVFERIDLALVGPAGLLDAVDTALRAKP
jgi:N-acetylglutamate synthase-like GNAT family acetyltransferase